MIDSTDQGDFNVSFDKKDHGSEQTQEILEGKVDSLTWKVTLLSIIVPCLIGIIVVVAYFSIKQKVVNYHDLGTSEVRELSHILETRMADLDEQHQALNQKVTRSLPGISKNESALKKNRSDLRSLSSTVKKNQESLADTDQQLSLLQNEVAVLTRTVEKLQQHQEAAQNGLDELQAALDKLDRQKASREEVERVFSAYDSKLDQKLRTLEDNWQKRFQALEKRLSPAPAAEGDDAALPSSSSAAEKAAPVQSSPPPSPDGITEKNLSQ